MTIKLSIRNKFPGHQLTMHGLEICLNDMPIENGVAGLDLALRLGESNQATIVLRPSEIEVDAEVLAMLQANVKEK